MAKKAKRRPKPPPETLPDGVFRDDDGLRIAVWSADRWPFLSAVAALPFLAFGREPVGVVVPVVAVSVAGYVLTGLTRTAAKRSRERAAPAATLRRAARLQTQGAVALLVAGLLLFGLGVWQIRTAPMATLSWAVGAFAAILPACYWSFHAHRTAARMYGLARLAERSWQYQPAAYPRFGGGGPAGYVAPNGAGWPTAVTSAGWAMVAAIALLGLVVQTSTLLGGLRAETFTELVTVVVGVVAIVASGVWLSAARALLGDGLPPARLRRFSLIMYVLAAVQVVSSAVLLVTAAVMGASGAAVWTALGPSLIPAGVLVGVGLYAASVARGVDTAAST